MGVVLLRLLLKAQVGLKLPAAVPRSSKSTADSSKEQEQIEKKKEEEKQKAEKAALAIKSDRSGICFCRKKKLKNKMPKRKVVQLLQAHRAIQDPSA